MPGVPDGAAFRIMDLFRTDLGDDSFQGRRDVFLFLRGRVVAQLVVHLIGIGTDHGDVDALGQGQEAVVLQQDHSLPGCLQGRFTVLRAAYHGRVGKVGVGVLEEAEAEFKFQHAAHSLIQGLAADLAGFDVLLEPRIALRPQIHVHAGLQGQFAGFLRALRHVVRHLELVNAVEIGHDDAVEAPFSA